MLQRLSVRTCALVGTYDEREVTPRHGKLYLQRSVGPPLEMRLAGTDRFTLVDAAQAQIEFVRDASGRPMQMRVLNPQGDWETATRVK